MVKFKFSQIETGITAFIGNLELKLQEFIPDLPVGILETGNASYFLNKKFGEVVNKEIYQKVPRFVIGINDVQPQTDQNSNKYNKFCYNLDGENYIAVGRRICLMLPITTNFVSSNIIKGFEHFEIMMSILSSENVFTYEFLGNTYEGSYNISGPSIERPNMDISSGTRNVTIKIEIELYLQILVPKVASIIKASEAGYEAVKYDINIKESDNNAFSDLTITKDE